jgi:alpha-galactosidase
MIVDGCNTIGHLSAGLFELQRIGDDTSGTDWNRTRDMGVNCLAFRSPQQGTFFFVDADCAGLAKAGAVPWDRNREWLDLLGRSGTPLFVSWPKRLVGLEQETALAAALKGAAGEQPVCEPVDWLTGKTPSKWVLDGATAEFDWSSPAKGKQ